MKISVIVTAGGSSVRFGANKLLEKINGKEVLEETKLAAGDWVQIKDIGFQII